MMVRGQARDVRAWHQASAFETFSKLSSGEKIPATQLRSITKIFDDNDLGPVVSAFPPSRLTFLPNVPPSDPRRFGYYTKRHRSICLSNEVIRHHMGFALEPGQIYTVMSTAPSKAEFLGLALLHEYGHHLANVLALTPTMGRSISRYGATNEAEYHAETWTAYFWCPDELEDWDLAGFSTMRALVLELKGKIVNHGILGL